MLRLIQAGLIAALIQAGAIRLRPILMTTFALIAGMIPVAMGTGEGAQFRAPMGVAVIGNTIYAIDGASAPGHSGSSRTVQLLRFKNK